MFGNGLGTARALRARILESVGAGAAPDADAAMAAWNTGQVTTYLVVEPGADSTPDLAVFRVVTPAGAGEDLAAALGRCGSLNSLAGTSRWVAEPAGADEDAWSVRASCTFTVGPHNVAALEPFILACVREQAAAGAGRTRAAGPDPDGGGAALGYALKAAFRQLVQEMLESDSGAWLSASADDEDGPELTCEMPFCWDAFPDGVIGSLNEPGLPTALVQTAPGPGGLLITMRVRGSLGDDLPGDLNTLNRLGLDTAAGTHNVGAWHLRGDEAVYAVHLPAALAALPDGLDAVMREVLLTLARQALLARRVLLAEGELADRDRDTAVGLAAAGSRGRLAWGETGEGRNLGAEVLAEIYHACVGGDTDWAEPWPDGFTWWPYQQAQTVTANPYSGDNGGGSVVHISTHVRRDVTTAPEALEAIATLNAELSQSALVLRDDGCLDLACRVFLHEGTRWWASNWAQALAADQLVTARELGERLAGLGTLGVSEHPASGPRPEPDDLFTIREDFLIPAAAKVRAGLTALVPLLAVTGQYILPHDLSADDEDGLSFRWHVSGGHHRPGTEPAVQVTIGRGESPAGIGWVVRSNVPVAGDAAARARWCNARNAAMFDSSDGGDQTAVGGWGAAEDGGCCLTTWMSPHFARDVVSEAAGLVGNLLRYHQGTVTGALSADPGAVPGTPLTAEDLASGLESAISAFAEALDYPDDASWSAVPLEAGVYVTMEGRSWSGQPFAQMRYHDAPDAGSEDFDPESPPHYFRLELTVPLGYNRTQLSLLYSALLSFTQSDTRPGEADGFPSGWYARMLPYNLEELEEGEDGAFTFTVGAARARFEIEYVKFGPNSIESALWMYDPYCMRIAGIVPDAGAEIFAVDDDMIGSWTRYRDAVAYEIVMPPIPAVWPTSVLLEETLMWLGRHVVAHVQAAIGR